MIFAKVRKSRRRRRCEQEFAHKRTIEPGDLYEVVSVSPNDGILGAGKWYSFPNCAACANPKSLLEYLAKNPKENHQ